MNTQNTVTEKTFGRIKIGNIECNNECTVNEPAYWCKAVYIINNKKYTIYGEYDCGENWGLDLFTENHEILESHEQTNLTDEEFEFLRCEMVNALDTYRAEEKESAD